MYDRAPLYHAVWFAVILALYILCFSVLIQQPTTGLRILALAGGTIAIMQLGLFAHEVGHGGVARDYRVIEVLGQLSNSFLIGFGFSHWQTSHVVHHNHPNTENVDPDMESRGYALYEHAARRDRGLLARWQPVTLFLGFLLWGFAIRVKAVTYAVQNFSRRTAVDLVCVAAHLGLWLGVGSALAGPVPALINYSVMTMLNGLYMGAILVVPHVGTGTRSTTDELPYFERQVAFSRNYDASLLGTLLCGGLNLQIEHHLLPGVPCVRLRRARPIVAAYCAQYGLPYRQAGYLAAWREVISHLSEMSRLARARAAVSDPGTAV